MEGTGIYLYGVMAKGTVPQLLPGGIGGSEVYSLPCGEFGALASRTSPEEADFEPEAILAHEQVLASAMQAGTVIPAAFGHLFPDEAELCRFLDSAGADLRSKLAYLDGRVEVGVKATWRKEAFQSDIATPELQALLALAQQSSDSPSLAMSVGELVERLLTERRSHYVAAICSQLEGMAAEMTLNEPAATRIVFNAAFLVDKGKHEAFLDHLEAIVKPYEQTLQFVASGPWPPYNFAQVRIEQGS